MLKRMFSAIALITVVLLATACSSDNYETEPNPFIEDLEHIIYVLENNFGVLEVAHWAHGIDYREIFANARETILAVEEMCRDKFAAHLGYHFRPLLNTGHFLIITTYDSLQFLENIASSQELRILSSPEREHFYGDMDEDRLTTLRYEHFRLYLTYGGQSNRHMVDSPEDIVFIEPSVDIIKENEIVYISTGMMSLFTLELEEEISQLDLDGLEHIIIDLRGNSGGQVAHFTDTLMRPLINRHLETPEAFILFSDGPYTRRLEPFFNYAMTAIVGERPFAPVSAYRPIDEVLADFYLPELPYVDANRLHYGVPASFEVDFMPQDYSNGFNGKIWLLVDGRVGSAAQIFAWLVKETGFATLVGETTGGNMGGPSTIAFLPNTGIMFRFDALYLTDSRGRSLEAGTIPHHFNRPGMDALQTVLALIEEGEY